LRLGVNYQHLGGRGPGKVVYAPTAPSAPGLTNPKPIIPANRWTSINQSLNTLIGSVTAPPGIYPLDTGKVYQNVDVLGINGHIDWNLGPAVLTVIPAYQRVTQDSLVMPALYFSTNNYFNGAPSVSEGQTLEVRLGHADNRVKWVIGGYYFNEDQDSYNAVRLGRASDTAFIAKLNTRAYAAFGEATYSLTSRLRATAGLRYTDETKSSTATAMPSRAAWPVRRAVRPSAAPVKSSPRRVRG
jgi:iron complex outermembrane receptor protein